MRQIKFKIWCKGTSDNANFNKPGKYYKHKTLRNGEHTITEYSKENS